MIFSVLGFMAQKQQVPVSEVVKSGKLNLMFLTLTLHTTWPPMGSYFHGKVSINKHFSVFCVCNPRVFCLLNASSRLCYKVNTCSAARTVHRRVSAVSTDSQVMNIRKFINRS